VNVSSAQNYRKHDYVEILIVGRRYDSRGMSRTCKDVMNHNQTTEGYKVSFQRARYFVSCAIAASRSSAQKYSEPDYVEMSIEGKRDVAVTMSKIGFVMIRSNRTAHLMS